MSPEIRLFSDDFSGMDSLLVKFLRNQPGNRPAKHETDKYGGEYRTSRDIAQRQRRDDTHARENSRDDCMQY